jgi:hypothetical protein
MERRESFAGSFYVDNLTGLRTGDHILEVGVLVDRPRGIVALFGFPLGAALLLVLLFLFAGLLSAAFFQLVVLLTWPTLSVPLVAGTRLSAGYVRDGPTFRCIRINARRANNG